MPVKVTGLLAPTRPRKKRLAGMIFVETYFQIQFHFLEFVSLRPLKILTLQSNSRYRFHSPDISRKNETHDELGNLQK